MSPWFPWSRCSTGIAGRSVASAVAATVSVADGIVGSAQAAAPAVMGEGGVIREPRSGADFVPRAALDAYSPALDVYSPAPAPVPVPGHLSVLVSVLAPSAARSADAKRAADGPGFAARCDWPRPIGFGGPLRVAVRYAASRLVQQARHAAPPCVAAQPCAVAGPRAVAQPCAVVQPCVARGPRHAAPAPAGRRARVRAVPGLLSPLVQAYRGVAARQRSSVWLRRAPLPATRFLCGWSCFVLHHVQDVVPSYNRLNGRGFINPAVKSCGCDRR